MAKRQFIVTLDIPPGVTLPEMEEYIAEAVQIWQGQMHPEAPLRDLNGNSVRVKRIPQKRIT